MMELGVVLSADPLNPTLEFFTSSLGMAVESIGPADAPTHATLAGFGCRIHLEPSAGAASATRLRLRCTDGRSGTLTAPNGTVVELLPLVVPVAAPPLESTFQIMKASDCDSWRVGRAGMMYRDLAKQPAVVASHIRIPGGGPVPDYVHFHEVLFQLIYCHRGWVKVVYEGQGEPFVLLPGDCVTQPPRIRHRVLESSDDLYVVEIGAPAIHVTRADPDVPLPSPSTTPDRMWEGQRFLRFTAADAMWIPVGVSSFRVDSGVAAATSGLADVDFLKGSGGSVFTCTTPVPSKRFLLIFVVSGSVSLELAEDVTPHSLTADDSVTIPVGTSSYTLSFTSPAVLLRFQLDTP